MKERACEGGRTLQHVDGSGEFEECVECEMRVRWDLVDHRLFGFQNCVRRTGRQQSEVIPPGVRTDRGGLVIEE